ncbi:MAG: exodeoxyribonuclease VII large subunit [Chloroflexia bacterium]|nr:exodeoxyribonuclease VII large subunit [Chloroflexia bacterium]
MTGRVVSVGLLTRYLKELIDRDDILGDIWVEGEASNVHVSQAGHIYFTLLDAESQIKCALFRKAALRQLYLPRIGDRITSHGRVGIYERDGTYQLYVDVIQASGTGIVALERERLRQQLAAEGLFEPSRKRLLPVAPAVIGVVTSKDGSVWHDILTVLRRRYPLTHVILAPSPVQGDHAPEALIAALSALQEDLKVEVIIVARGGGSDEELAAFNDERLLRAVFACRVPVISGIGHETDRTLIDEVADVRAATPTAAAELCTPSMRELQTGVNALRNRLQSAYSGLLAARRGDHISLSTRLAHGTPAKALVVFRARRERSTIRLFQVRWHHTAVLQARLNTHVGLLNAFRPRSVLSRGYSVLSKSISDAPLTSIDRMTAGDRITAQLLDGTLGMRIESVLPHLTVQTPKL